MQDDGAGRMANAITPYHIAALQYLSKRGGRVPEHDLTPLTIGYLEGCEAHGLVNREHMQKATYWVLTDRGRHVQAVGRFDQDEGGNENA